MRILIQAGMQSKDRAKRRAVLLALVHEVKYAEGVAELVLKIPTLPGANCQHSEPAVRACHAARPRIRHSLRVRRGPCAHRARTAHGGTDSVALRRRCRP